MKPAQLQNSIRDWAVDENVIRDEACDFTIANVSNQRFAAVGCTDVCQGHLPGGVEFEERQPFS